MNNKEKKEYLLQYGKACRRIKNLKEQLVSLLEVEQSAKIQQLSDMPKGSSRGKDLSDLMVRIEKLREKINNEIIRSVKIRTIIEEAIFEIEDADQMEVLRLRYIELLQFKEIIDRMKYSEAQVYKIHGNALTNIKLRVK